jgi:DNA-binding CsgD family transcriptional regulator
VATKEAELTAAVEELVAQGLSPTQVQQLLGLSPER